MDKESILWLTLHLVILLMTILFGNQFSCNICYFIGIAAVVLGVLIWIIAKINMGKIEVSIYPKKLVTKGIYSKIRHPLYLGVKLAFIGLALVFNSAIGIILIIVLLIPLHVIREQKEEKEIAKKFKKEYIKYKENTWF